MVFPGAVPKVKWEMNGRFVFLFTPYILQTGVHDVFVPQSSNANKTNKSSANNLDKIAKPNLSVAS